MAIPVVTPAMADPWSVVIGMIQSIIDCAGNPGMSASRPNGPVKATVKKAGITSDGMNVDGIRGMFRRLRFATSHTTEDDNPEDDNPEDDTTGVSTAGDSTVMGAPPAGLAV